MHERQATVGSTGPGRSTSNYIHVQNTKSQLVKACKAGLGFNTIVATGANHLPAKALFNSSLWFCIYTSRYSAKKETKQTKKKA